MSIQTPSCAARVSVLHVRELIEVCPEWIVSAPLGKGGRSRATWLRPSRGVESQYRLLPLRKIRGSFRKPFFCKTFENSGTLQCVCVCVASAGKQKVRIELDVYPIDQVVEALILVMRFVPSQLLAAAVGAELV